MSPIEVFIRDNKHVLSDYFVLLNDNTKRYCFYTTEEKNMDKFDYSGFKSVGGKSVERPICLDKEDFLVLRGEL